MGREKLVTLNMQNKWHELRRNHGRVSVVNWTLGVEVKVKVSDKFQNTLTLDDQEETSAINSNVKKIEGVLEGNVM